MLYTMTLINQYPIFAIGLFATGLGLGLIIFTAMTLVLMQRLKHAQTQLSDARLVHAALAQQHEKTQHQLQQKELSFMQLHTQLQERERSHQQQQLSFEQQKQHMTQEFEHIAQKALNANSAQLSQQQEQSVKLLLTPFQNQITHFGQQVQQFQHSQVSSHASLNNELQHIKTLNQAITQEAKNLTRALKGDKKLTGTWGELQLERSLQAAGLENTVHYRREANYHTQDGQNRRPDFILYLPDEKHIVIDSKMSLVAYEAAVSAKDISQQNSALDQHVKALKKHINDLQQKDYSALVGLHSPDFVLMYVAAEPALTEALKHNHQLYEYAANKNILLVSQTTLIPIIKTVANLWLRERGQRQAYALAEKAGDIYQQLCTLAERFHKLGRTLQTAGSHYNDTVTALTGKRGLHGKVQCFSELAKGAKLTPTPPIHQDIDLHRLEPLLDD